MPPAPAEPFAVTRDGTTLHGESAGAGPPILLLHGLTATRRYVLQGSRALERAGRTLVSYDARGHGTSDPAADGDYGYPALAADALAIMEARGLDDVVLMGSSMGAATAIAAALAVPERVRALVVVTPAHRGRPSADLERWDRLSQGLAEGGVDGFMRAFGTPRVPERYRDTIATVLRQRLARHEHPLAVAEALRLTPRSAAFDGMEALERLPMPVLIVASNDLLDPEHPMSVARDYAERIPDAELVSEAEGESPLAWRGGSLSATVRRFLEARGL